jgi:A/G-specific adenine glycosylase
MTRQKFQKLIWGWYHGHKPNLPWRNTRDPYKIFVSEVMLQQTQIPRVLIKYREFLKKFPTPKALANASLADVLSVWQGMGYNRRAMYLYKAAQKVVAEYNSKFPITEEELQKFPGMGPYSRRAVLCFSHEICEPFVETNIRRVIIHHFFKDTQNVSDTAVLEILAKVSPQENLREWYYALMDYGREGLKKHPNANRNSKHYSKQSSYRGSRRYVRARIIEFILQQKKTTRDALFLFLQKDSGVDTKHLAQLDNILVDLKNEGLLHQGRYLSIS